MEWRERQRKTVLARWASDDFTACLKCSCSSPPAAAVLGAPGWPGGTGGGTAPGRAGWGWDPGGFALVALGLSGAHCDYNSTVPQADACRCQHLSFCINIPRKKFMYRIQNWSLSWDKAQLSLRLTWGRSVPSQYRSWELEEERLLCVLVVLRVLWDFFFFPLLQWQMK